MDKKIKKKIDKLRQQIQKMKNQLAGARQQDDEPGEIAKLEADIAVAQSEVEKLQAG
jgi:cell division septum initiation protein DivIVA